MILHLSAVALGSYLTSMALPWVLDKTGEYPIDATAAQSPVLETARLRLRRWESHDMDEFIFLCRDPLVMQFFNGLHSPEYCLEEIKRQEACFDAHGYGLWAVELKETGEFVGAVGIEPTLMSLQGMTARLSWKLGREYWGKSYAYEAGLAVLDYAFHTLRVKEAFAHVAPSNARSLRLIERLGFMPRAGKVDSYFKTEA